MDKPAAVIGCGRPVNGSEFSKHDDRFVVYHYYGSINGLWFTSIHHGPPGRRSHNRSRQYDVTSGCAAVTIDYRAGTALPAIDRNSSGNSISCVL